jgi:glucokinase
MVATRKCFLVGDIGATNARLAITAWSDGAIDWIHEARLADARFPAFDAAIDAAFAGSPVARAGIAAACFGVAGPIHGRRVRFTNRDWVLDADAIAASLDGAPVTLVNDLEAAAAGIDALPPADFAVLQDPGPASDGVRLVIGAGTGLGIAYSIPCGKGRRIVPSEGGHAGFAPQSARQRRLFAALSEGGARVEAEHVVSGAGIERIYATLRTERPDRESAELRKKLDRGHGAAAISRFALERADPLASEALDLFVDCFGTIAGDHALAVLPYGGVFVVGGIAAKILPRLVSGEFVRAFTDKGDFAALARSFPIAVVTNERLGLAGATLLASESPADARSPR